MEIYFDNAATTRPSESVMKEFCGLMLKVCGNPAAVHKIGREAERVINAAKRDIADCLSAAPEEIYFTSGGTESDNIAILGAAAAGRGRHVITTRAEHDAVHYPVARLGENGYDVEYLALDEAGGISLESLEAAIRQDTVLVSLMTVNNETGVITPIETIGGIIKKKNPRTLFHTDAVQGFGKIGINVRRSNVDILSVSGHKLHGPKGVGAIYIRNGARVDPIMYGGGQQKGLRPGTENPAGAAALACAAREAEGFLFANAERVFAVKTTLWEGISGISDIRLNGGDMEKTCPYVLNVSFPGLRSNVLLNALEAEGIYASAGSACSSRKTIESPVLKAMGLPHVRIDSAIRFSFSKFNTVEEAKACAGILTKKVEFLRKYGV